MIVVAYVPDLMDRSRFPKSENLAFARTLDELPALAAGAGTVIVDLNREGALDAIAPLTGVRRIGFTNHENVELLERANALGVEALPRSRFFSRIAQLVNDT